MRLLRGWKSRKIEEKWCCLSTQKSILKYPKNKLKNHVLMQYQSFLLFYFYSYLCMMSLLLTGLICFHCFAGNKPGLRVSCPKCKQHFCLDCDIYIHESLHNCPGCESARHSKLETSNTEEWWSGLNLHNPPPPSEKRQSVNTRRYIFCHRKFQHWDYSWMLLIPDHQC